jgi:transcriptional regulator of met regulon
MQLSPDTGTVESAIAELTRVIPLEALRSIRDDRERRQLRRDHIRRRIEMLEAAVD